MGPSGRACSVTSQSNFRAITIATKLAVQECRLTGRPTSRLCLFLIPLKYDVLTTGATICVVLLSVVTRTGLCSRPGVESSGCPLRTRSIWNGPIVADDKLVASIATGPARLRQCRNRGARHRSRFTQLVGFHVSATGNSYIVG